MQDETSITRAPTNPFAGMELLIERLLGADMRLIYGAVVPMGLIVSLVVVLTLSSSAWWLVAVVLVVEFAAVGLVVYAFMQMLDEDNDEEAGHA
ncbi:MAG: hypothetical protein ACLP8S_32930 [Solirubrobacteraceae bacterium]